MVEKENIWSCRKRRRLDNSQHDLDSYKGIQGTVANLSFYSSYLVTARRKIFGLAVNVADNTQPVLHSFKRVQDTMTRFSFYNSDSVTFIWLHCKRRRLNNSQHVPDSLLWSPRHKSEVFLLCAVFRDAQKNIIWPHCTRRRLDNSRHVFDSF